jgi:SAM-dependent methyltransferase
MGAVDYGQQGPACQIAATTHTVENMTKIEKGYDEFYAARTPVQVYPTEFVLRSFVGTYPGLTKPSLGDSELRVLDLGFGDGRNMPLLANLGMQVFGVEITDAICDDASKRLAMLGHDVIVKRGRNSSIPFSDAFFDHVVACHACYYVDEGTSFSDNLSEIARVMKPGARFLFSAPMATSYIVCDGAPLEDGHVRVANDPYGVRDGYILKKFDTAQGIRDCLRDDFQDFEIGECKNDWWGIKEHAWTVVCTRKATL